MTDTQIIKQALVHTFGKSRVLSVRHDRGTAAHWIRISMLVHKPTSCVCSSERGFYCSECKNELRVTHNKVEKIVKETGVEIATYTDDMGMGDHDCVLIDLKFIER